MSVVDPVRDGRGWPSGTARATRPTRSTASPCSGKPTRRPSPGRRARLGAGPVGRADRPDRQQQLPRPHHRPGHPVRSVGQPGVRPLSRGAAAGDRRAQRAGLRPVNNGVYRCGFATSQDAYDRAVASLFATLDDLDQRLATRRYLFGDSLTEADVRLWVTLARFDAVYVTHFKANLRRLADYPNLWPYARDLYSLRRSGAPPASARSSGTTTGRIRSSTRCGSCRPGRSWTGTPRSSGRPCPVVRNPGPQDRILERADRRNWPAAPVSARVCRA